MATRMDFGAAAIHLSDTIWFFAYVFKRRELATCITTFDDFVAEAAFPCLFVLLCFLACFTDVVGGSFAQSTENFSAIAASDSELGHVLSCLP